MAIKHLNPAFESFSFPLAKSAKELISESEKIGLPEELINEIRQFSERNLMIFRVNNAVLYDCCPNCLKAHLLKKAKVLGLNAELQEKISRMFKSESGHNGYYLDKNKIFGTE